jgi:hypothetical protein
MASPNAVLVNMVFVSWLSRMKLLWLSLFRLITAHALNPGSAQSER